MIQKCPSDLCAMNPVQPKRGLNYFLGYASRFTILNSKLFQVNFSILSCNLQPTVKHIRSTN